MSSDNSKTYGIIIIAAILLIIGVIVYNSYCNECLFEFPAGVGGTTGGGGTTTEKGGTPWGLFLLIPIIGLPLGGIAYWLRRRRGAAAGAGGAGGGGGTPYGAMHGSGGSVPHPSTRRETT